ncbi:MAG: hypothetical protein QNI84_00150 [Henriciella sp.]|nr:hypothetical protein [Henriciella sp.]
MSALKFPAHRAHEGTWTGTYRHIDLMGQEEELIQSHVVCEFPDDGKVFYRQTINLTHPDGSVIKAGFDGVDRGDHLWFDTPNFIGKSWETADGVILPNLQRKDEPCAHFVEVIIMGEGGTHRARTWHWFRGGQLFRRTLCDEVRQT